MINSDFVDRFDRDVGFFLFCGFMGYSVGTLYNHKTGERGKCVQKYRRVVWKRNGERAKDRELRRSVSKSNI